MKRVKIGIFFCAMGMLTACGGGTTIESEIMNALSGIWVANGSTGASVAQVYIDQSGWIARDESLDAGTTYCRRYGSFAVTQASQTNGYYYFVGTVTQTHASCDVSVGSVDTWRWRLDPQAKAFRITASTADPSRLDQDPFAGESGTECSADLTTWGSGDCTRGKSVSPASADGSANFSTAGPS